jgi:pyrroline-5-carboxylate reductase
LKHDALLRPKHALFSVALAKSKTLTTRQKHKHFANLTKSRQLGFLGVGLINSALVVGLLTAELEQDSKTVVLLSPRGHERARALPEKFPNRVQIGGNNQDVVDASEVVFVAVLPSQVKPLLESLTFRQGQQVISLVAGVSTGVLKIAIAPATHLVRAVPLPAAAAHASTTILSPSDSFASSIFSELGAVTEVPDSQLQVLWSCTALMGPIYARQRATSRWLQAYCVGKNNANRFVGSKPAMA